MRVFVIAIAIAALSGCTFPAIPQMASTPVTGPMTVIEGASVIATDKTVGDHIVSWASGKNCSSVRWERGLTYCEEDELSVQPNAYCYRTLGAVSCYDRPGPDAGRVERLGEDSYNRVAPSRR